MSEGKKVAILRRVLGSFYLTGTERLFFCPKCNHHKHKLSVNIDKDVFKCWVCDYNGRSVRKLIRYAGTFKDLTDWSELTNEETPVSLTDAFFAEEKEEEEQIVDLPEEFFSLANKNKPISSFNAHGYLRNRGITKQDIIRWKIGFCDKGPFAGRIIIPSFGLSGRPNYFVARSYTNDWKKYLNPPAKRDVVFNHLFVDFDADIILVEGVFDAIIAGPNSIPLLGSTLREKSKLFQEIVRKDTTVYIALDPDAEKKTMYLIKKLLDYGIEIHKIDITPFEDVAEMSKKEFQKRKIQSVIMDSDNYLLKTLMSI